MLGRRTALAWLCVTPLSTPFNNKSLLAAAAMSTNSNNMTPKTVNLLDIAAASIASTVTATRWIRQLTLSTSARQKDDGSLVTDADGLAQAAILKALHRVSKDVTIVGEESAEEMGQHLDKANELDDEAMDEKVWQRCHAEVRYRQARRGGDAATTAADDNICLPLSSSSDASLDSFTTTDSNADDSDEFIVDASRVSIFVDPLDGTKSYAHGEYDCVSILVGVVLDNEPVFGVVGKPFGYTGLTPIMDTKCVTIYGGPLIKGVYVAGGEEITVSHEQKQQQQDASSSTTVKPKAVISTSRSGGIVHDFCVYLGQKGLISPEPLLISGAGEKSLRIILRKENEALWFFPKAGTSLWDVAASDALLRSLGGRLTDKDGHNMNYLDKTRENAENTNGVVACIDPKLHDECIRIYHQEDWQTPS